MKIFIVIPKQYAGCGFYRQYQPHRHLQASGHIDVVLSDGTFDEEGNLAVDADIIHFHKGYYSPVSVFKCKQRGIAVVIDFDDWWYVDTEHLFYQDHLKRTTDMMTKALQIADYVTVATERLAVEARKYNKNVTVLPNAFDPSYKSCENKRVKEDKIVFGYLGGHCHTKDMEQLRGVNNRLSQSFNNYKFRLMGMDGSPIYTGYGNVLSDNGKLKETHFDWMEKADIWNYPQFYNYLDVSLVPLVNNKFNSLKSELKLIEAGFFKKAVIVSNVHPYRELIKHKENAMVVNKYGDWYKHCKYLLENPNAITDLGEALYETVKPFHIDNVNKKRLNFYNNVLKDINTNSINRRSSVPSIDELELYRPPLVSEDK